MKKMSRYFAFGKEIVEAGVQGQLAVKFHECPSCQKERLWIKYGTLSRQVRCSGCRATNISLSLLKLVQELDLPTSSAVYEMSFHGSTFNYLISVYRNFYCSEYFGENLARGSIHNGVRHEDVQRLSFEDSKFSLITSTEVFEHVPDYLAGLKEIFRVLKKQGVLLFTVPLFDIEKNLQIAEQKDGKTIWLGKPELHDSRVWGVNSVPVFWRHSQRDLEGDLRSIGFEEVSAVNVKSPFDAVEQIVFRCIK
jgi:SAM-dependent methyltransferase